MPEPICPRDEFWEGSDPGWTLAAIVRKDGLALQLADVNSVTLTVWDIQTKTQIYTISQGPAGIIHDTPQLTPYWLENTIGFNFGHYLEGPVCFATFPDQDGKMYRLEYEILCVDGSGTIMVVREILCKARFKV